MVRHGNCKRGHPFSDENTMIRMRDRGRGPELSRTCRICHYAANNKYLSKPDARSKSAARAKSWRKRHPERVRHHRLQQSFGMSLDDYNALLRHQHSTCALCPFQPTTKNLPVDHCHKTGRIRGLLCIRCNTMLGNVEKIGLDKIQQYLAV